MVAGYLQDLYENPTFIGVEETKIAVEDECRKKRCTGP